MQSRRSIFPSLIQLAVYFVGLFVFMSLIAFFLGNGINARLVAYLEPDLQTAFNPLHLLDVFRRLSVKVSDEPVSCCITWSADGTQIAFNGANALFIWNLQTTSLTSLNLLSNAFYIRDWSQNGKLLFGSDGYYNNLYQVELETQTLTQLTDLDKPYVSSIAVSPDARFAFFSASLQSSSEIYKLDIEGKNIEQVVGGVNPIFSPDGTQIIFILERTGNAGLYLMSGDGSRQKQLAQIANENVYLVRWSPDGKRIVFETLNPAKSSDAKMYVMDADGSNRRQLSVNTPDTFLAPVLQLCWLDNTHLIFGGRGLNGAEAYLVDINTGESRLVLHNSSAPYQIFVCQP